MNLRSKQIVRVLAGIGPFRCLFLISVAVILFYALTKVTSVWVLPAFFILIIWLYHNGRKRQGVSVFTDAWNQKIVYGRIFIARFAVYYFRDYCCKLYFFVGYHADCDSSAVDSSCQVSFYSSANAFIIQRRFAV